jgi:hypothetical protein
MPKRLDPETIQAIQQEYGDVPAKEIAAKYSVSMATVFRLASLVKGRRVKNKASDSANGNHSDSSLAGKVQAWWENLEEEEQLRICVTHLLSSLD